MTDAARDRQRGPARFGVFGALLIAAAISAATAWLLLRSAPEPGHLTPFVPRPELLDKPHRYVPVLDTAPSAP